ncbi:MAG: BtpA/SgcQ family protein [Sulfolobales archaeon]
MSSKYSVIATIHLPRLPHSSVKSDLDLGQIIERAVSETRTLEELGYDGVIVENFGDYPYRKRVRDPLTLASMSIIVREIVKSTSLEVGVNLLRNSGREAYAIAVAAKASFIRVNALIESIVSDSGLIEAEAPRLFVIRRNYPQVKIYADISVKHATSLDISLGILRETHPMLSKSSNITEFIKALTQDYVERGGADKLIATGLRSGSPPQLDFLKTLKKSSPVPVLIGSGANTENIKSLYKYSDGVIIGSFIRESGRAGAPLDIERARSFIRTVREITLSNT